MLVGYAIGALLAIAAMLGASVLLHVTFLSFTRDLWMIQFVYAQRPQPARWIGITLVVVLMALGLALFGPKTQAVVFPLVAVGPWLTVNLVRLYAWWSDEAETKRAALEIRKAEALRLSEPVPTLEQRFPWREYVFDVARVRQQTLYEPPPI
ncbi:hypothetical protein PMI02_03742 [Novosphingobium sp. AP12]|nr:hypothetical protein PMI02_03742 [Novosphingobium sp. AP12]